jgi:hypothetical protein
MPWSQHLQKWYPEFISYPLEKGAIAQILILLIPVIENDEEKVKFHEYFRNIYDNIYNNSGKNRERFHFSNRNRDSLIQCGFGSLEKLPWKQDFDLEDSKEINNYLPQTYNNLWRYFWYFLKLTFPKVKNRYLLLLLWNNKVQLVFLKCRLSIKYFEKQFRQFLIEREGAKKKVITCILNKYPGTTGLVSELINSFDTPVKFAWCHPLKESFMFSPDILNLSTNRFKDELGKLEFMDFKLGSKTLGKILFQS